VFGLTVMELDKGQISFLAGASLGFVFRNYITSSFCSSG
jgi:hypothetical protein